MNDILNYHYRINLYSFYKKGTKWDHNTDVHLARKKNEIQWTDIKIYINVRNNVTNSRELMIFPSFICIESFLFSFNIQKLWTGKKIVGDEHNEWATSYQLFEVRQEHCVFTIQRLSRIEEWTNLYFKDIIFHWNLQYSQV